MFDPLRALFVKDFSDTRNSDAQAILLSTHGSSVDDAEVGRHQLQTGDAVVVDGLAEQEHDERIIFEIHYVGKIDGERVQLYKRKRHAYGVGQDHAEDIQPIFEIHDKSRLTPISGEKLAELRLSFVCGPGALPRPIRDIAGAGRKVMVDVFLGLACGSLPILGFVSSCYLSYVYFYKYGHLSMTGLATQGDWWKRLKRAVEGFALFYQVVIVFNMQWAIVNTYFAYYAKLAGAGHSSDSDGHREHILKDMMEDLFLLSIKHTCTISAILLLRILFVHAIQVYTEISHYKALAYNELTERSKKVLEMLMQKMPHVFEPHDPPLHTDDEALKEPVGALRRMWCFLSSVVMLVSLLIMFQNFNNHHPGRGPVSCVLNVAGICLSSQNWYWLLERLCSARIKMRRNCKQLVLFRTLSLGHDYKEWPRTSKQVLRTVLKECYPNKQGDPRALITLATTTTGFCGTGRAAKRMADLKDWVAIQFTPRYARGNVQRSRAAQDLDESHQPLTGSQLEKALGLLGATHQGPHVIDVAPDNHLGAMVDAVMYHREEEVPLRFDFRKKEDIEDWWTLRGYMALDFSDESGIMDYSLIVTSLILLNFLFLGFTDWSTHKHEITPHLAQFWEEMTKGEQDTGKVNWLHAIGVLGPIAGCFLSVFVIMVVSMLFLDLVESSAQINGLWHSDKEMLLGWILRLQHRKDWRTRSSLVKLRSSSESNSDAMNGGSEVHNAAHQEPQENRESYTYRAESVQYMHALIEKMHESDQKQRILYIVIDERTVSAIMIALSTVILKLLWETVRPLLQNVDLQHINSATKVFT